MAGLGLGGASAGAASAPKAARAEARSTSRSSRSTTTTATSSPPTGSDGLLVDGRRYAADDRPGRWRRVPHDPPEGPPRRGTRNTLTVAAGDLIGGSPFLSGLFKDEPSVETLDTLGLDVSGVGNHEFDEGVPELLRMQYGGCHPIEGCFDADGYSGAAFDYLAANVTYKKGAAISPPSAPSRYGNWWQGSSTGRTVLPPTAVKRVAGVKVGFIGMTLESTPTLVAQAGHPHVDFRDEVVTANAAAKDLAARA